MPPDQPDLFGADLDPFMQTAVRHFATMTALVEELPVADNQLRLDRQTRMRELGLMRADATRAPRYWYVPAWDDMTPAAQTKLMADLIKALLDERRVDRD